jgi:hypothetical protein
MPEASRSAPPPRIVDKLVRSVRLSQYNVLLSIPESARSFQRIIEIPVTRFPFFIIEDRDFEYGGLAFVAERLKKLSRVEVMTMSFERLRLRQGFRPSVPGTDNMGELKHWHVTDSSLKPPESKVFDQELAEIVGDA